MKHLRTILLFLLLGVVVNVGVAWGSVFKVHYDVIRVLRQRVTPKHYESIVFDTPRGEYWDWRAFSGWPMASLQMNLIMPISRADQNSLEHGILVSNLPVIIGIGDQVRLPIQPVWLGFIVNTVFYAALLWLLIPGPFALRRYLRSKRGVCVKCGYDLKGAAHAVCPECGVSPIKEQLT